MSHNLREVSTAVKSFIVCLVLVVQYNRQGWEWSDRWEGIANGIVKREPPFQFIFSHTNDSDVQ